ncbi:hypothetical protein BH10CYA1_BH10CYA1_53770 [soil metagenome]
MKSKNIWIWDNDGTLCEFPSWFGAAIRKMLPIIAERLGVSEAELGEEIGRNMIAHRTHETAYPFVGPYFEQIWTGRSHDDFIAQVTEPFFKELDWARTTCRSYPLGLRALQSLSTTGSRNFALSDAPLECALAKIVALNMQGQLSGVFAMESFIPSDELIWNKADFEYCQNRVTRMRQTLGAHFEHAAVFAIPQGGEKPSTAGVESMTSICNFSLSEIAGVVGDSHAKDGGLADKLGVPFFHASHGTQISDLDSQVISHLLNPDKGTQFSWHKSEHELPPIFAILDNEDVLQDYLRTAKEKAA